MTQEQALNILIEGVKVAYQRGAYEMKEVVALSGAIDTFIFPQQNQNKQEDNQNQAADNKNNEDVTTEVSTSETDKTKETLPEVDKAKAKKSNKGADSNSDK